MKNLRVDDACWKRVMTLKLKRGARNMTVLINDLLDNAENYPLAECKVE